MKARGLAPWTPDFVDTGKTVDTRYDAADVHEWATLALTTDAAGHKDSETIACDDATHNHLLFATLTGAPTITAADFVVYV